MAKDADGFGPDGVLLQPAFVNHLVAALPQSEIPAHTDEACTWASRQDLRAIALNRHAHLLAVASNPTPASLALAGKCVSNAILICEKWVRLTMTASTRQLHLAGAIAAAGEWHGRVVGSFLTMASGGLHKAADDFEEMARELDDASKMDGPRAWLVARLREAASAAAAFAQDAVRGQRLLSSALQSSRSAGQRGHLLIDRCMLGQHLVDTCASAVLADVQLVLKLLKWDYDEFGMSNMHYLMAMSLRVLGREREAVMAYAQARYCESREKYFHGKTASAGLELRKSAISAFQGRVTDEARATVSAQVSVSQQTKRERLERAAESGPDEGAHDMGEDVQDARLGEETMLTGVHICPAAVDAARGAGQAQAAAAPATCATAQSLKFLGFNLAGA